MPMLMTLAYLISWCLWQHLFGIYKLPALQHCQRIHEAVSRNADKDNVMMPNLSQVMTAS